VRFKNGKAPKAVREFCLSNSARNSEREADSVKIDRRTKRSLNRTGLSESSDATDFYSMDQNGLVSVDCVHGVDADAVAILPTHFNVEGDVLFWVRAALAHSPTMSALCRKTNAAGWMMTLGDLNNGGYHLDTEERVLVLDQSGLSPEGLGRSAYFRNGLILNAIRALRDIGHEEMGGDIESRFAPEHILMLERVRMADCESVAILAAWELRAAGVADIWRHLIGSNEGDMAMVFARTMERDPASQFNGVALSFAFRQWYADETRVNACDHEVLEYLDEVLEGSSGNPFGRTVPAGIDIERLSCLPNGTAYLRGLGEAVLRDPMFAGLNDPVNQTHLFHIIYDTEVVMVENVPFRDAKLARLIFPDSTPMVTVRR
jgi:hypothetical protein